MTSLRPHPLEYAKQVSIAALCVVLIGVLLSVRVRVNDALEAWRTAGDATTAAARQLSEAAAVYNKQLTSEKNLKAMDATIALGATLQGTARLINTQTIPRVNDNLDEMKAATQALQAAAWETKVAIAVNGGHLSEILVQTRNAAEEFKLAAEGLHKIADETGAEVPQLAAAFKSLIASGQATTEQVNKLLADPKLPELIAQAERLLRESGDVAANLDATTAEMPPLMKTARRWQTPINVARLVSVLIGLL